MSRIEEGRNQIGPLLNMICEGYVKSVLVDHTIVERVLEVSTTWNKLSVMNKFLSDLEQFELYEDEDDFPYMTYVDSFLEEGIKELTKENK